MSNWTQSGYDPSEHNFRKGEIDTQPNGGYPDNYFFADSIRSVVIGFGNFFSNLYVIRYDENGEPIKRIQVPLKYGPRMKSHDFRVEQESGKKYYIPLPNITYRIDSLSFAGERYAGAGEVRGFYSDYFEKNGVDYILTNKFWRDIQPVPYNITISMEAKTEHISDANQILEQILVRFAPESYFDLKEFWFVNKRRSIKMVCESSNIEMNTDFGEEDKREITVSFSFKIEAFLYKPIENSSIIDQILTTLKAEKTTEIYHNRMIGNYDGSLTSRYDFSEEFGTKIGHVYQMLPFEEQPTPEIKDDLVIQKWNYEELKEITNYPKGSKLLTSMSSIKDPNSGVWKSYDWLNAFKGSIYVDWIDETNGLSASDLWTKKYWSVTADSLDIKGIGGSGTNIYQIYYNPDFVCTAGVLNKDGSILEPGIFGGTIIKEHKNLFGFGDFAEGSNHYFGTKNAELGDEVIQDAPYIINSYVENKD